MLLFTLVVVGCQAYRLCRTRKAGGWARGRRPRCEGVRPRFAARWVMGALCGRMIGIIDDDYQRRQLNRSTEQCQRIR